MAVPRPTQSSAAKRPLVPSCVSPLRRDVGCSGNLNWRCEVEPHLDPRTVEHRLGTAGWESRCQHPALRVFRHGNGHEVAWVLSSGRIQIRVSIFVDRALRKTAATKIYQTLTESLTNDLVSAPDAPSSSSQGRCAEAAAAASRKHLS